MILSDSQAILVIIGDSLAILFMTMQFMWIPTNPRKSCLKWQSNYSSFQICICEDSSDSHSYILMIHLNHWQHYSMNNPTLIHDVILKGFCESRLNSESVKTTGDGHIAVLADSNMFVKLIVTMKPDSNISTRVNTIFYFHRCTLLTSLPYKYIFNNSIVIPENAKYQCQVRHCKQLSLLQNVRQ